MNQQKKVNINNSLISYFEFGDQSLNKTIVILHGWGLSSFVYLELAKQLFQKKYRVLVIDIPGFGNSKIPIKKWTYEQYADSIAEFIKTVIQTKTILLGHSFGGGVSIALAAKYPSLIERVLLVDSAGIPINIPLPFLGSKKVLEMLFQFFLKGGFIPSAKMSLAFFVNILKDPFAMYHSIQLPNNEDLTQTIKKIKVPINIYWAKKDMMVTVEKAKMISELTNSPIVFAPDHLYHDWCITHPKVFIEYANL
jgi:pimeloyl-ACP methyl ester carboxylesterase